MKTKTHPFAHLTPDEKDSLVLSAIVGAAAMFPERAVKPYCGHDAIYRKDPFDPAWGSSVINGPCCAVGAGILFQNLGPLDGHALALFAEKYDVSRAYANGVSIGFESELSYDVSRAYANGVSIGFESELSYDYELPKSEPDYSDVLRGIQVGKSAFEALHGGGV